MSSSSTSTRSSSNPQECHQNENENETNNIDLEEYESLLLQPPRPRHRHRIEEEEEKQDEDDSSLLDISMSSSVESTSLQEMRSLLSSTNDVPHENIAGENRMIGIELLRARNSFEDVVSRAKECISGSIGGNSNKRNNDHHNFHDSSSSSPSPSSNKNGENGNSKLQRRNSRHRHHEDAEEIMARTLTHIDTIEDEFDELTHKRLLPVNLQIALEENVFGWSNLISDVLGHIFYPLISAWITYKLITFCYESFGLLQSEDESNSSDGTDEDVNQVQVQVNHNFETFLIALRNVWTMGSLITAYRTVRRRRKVWLSHSDKKSLQAVDRTTKMGHKWREHKTRQSLRRKIAKAAAKYDAKLLQSKRVREASELPLHIIARIPLVKNMLYSHGGYFAAAPYMLHDPQWIYILRQLMPDVYVEVARRVHLDSAKLIHWAENNPVVAAYGNIMSQNINGHSVALEWDVFLDPILVTRLTKALDVKESLMERSEGSLSRRYRSKNIDHLNNLIRSRTFNLVASMLIAHGNATQLLMEQFPKPHFIKSYNFTRVKRPSKTLGGGIEVWRWLATYAEALKMGRPICNSRAGSDDEGTGEIFASLIDDVDDDHNEATMSEFSSEIGSTKRIPIRHSVKKIKNLMGGEFTVLIDVKSRHVDKRGMCIPIFIYCIPVFQMFQLSEYSLLSFQYGL